LKDINDAVIRNGAVIELQEKILAARQKQTALLERLSGTLHMDARFQAPVSKPITSINIGRMCKNPHPPAASK
jgi:hypothetical protein